MRKVNKTIKFDRGQVWILQHDSNELDENREMSHYLIISNKQNNERGYQINVLPIHIMKNNFIYPMQVDFEDFDGTKFVIDCDKIYTKPISNFLGEYLYLLPESVLDRVNEKLAIQLGIQELIPGYDSIVRMIETIALNYKKEFNNKRKISDSQVSNICDKIETAFSSKFSQKEETIDADVQSKAKSTKAWSEEKKLQYLIDCDELSIDQVCTKYNITESTYHTKRSKLKKELGF